MVSDLSLLLLHVRNLADAAEKVAAALRDLIPALAECHRATQAGTARGTVDDAFMASYGSGAEAWANPAAQDFLRTMRGGLDEHAEPEPDEPPSTVRTELPAAEAPGRLEVARGECGPEGAVAYSDGSVSVYRHGHVIARGKWVAHSGGGGCYVVDVHGVVSGIETVASVVFDRLGEALDGIHEPPQVMGDVPAPDPDAPHDEPTPDPYAHLTATQRNLLGTFACYPNGVTLDSFRSVVERLIDRPLNDAVMQVYRWRRYRRRSGPSMPESATGQRYPRA